MPGLVTNQIKDGAITSDKIADLTSVLTYSSPADAGGAIIASSNTSNKAYVDSLAPNLVVNVPCKLATADNLSNNGSISVLPTYQEGSDEITATLGVSDTFTVDGVNLGVANNGTRVLLKNEGEAQVAHVSVMTLPGSAGMAGGELITFYTRFNEGIYFWVQWALLNGDPGPSAPAGITYWNGFVFVVTPGQFGQSAATLAVILRDAINNSGFPLTASASGADVTVTNDIPGLVLDSTETHPNGSIVNSPKGEGLGPELNGVYTTAVSGFDLTLTRATDFDEDAEINTGNYTYIEEGTANAGSSFVVTGGSYPFTMQASNVTTGSTTIRLSSSASPVDDVYNGASVRIPGILDEVPNNYRGSGQARTITGYVGGSTKRATVAAWTPVAMPATGTVNMQFGGVDGIQKASGTTHFTTWWQVGDLLLCDPGGVAEIRYITSIQDNDQINVNAAVSNIGATSCTWLGPGGDEALTTEGDISALVSQIPMSVNEVPIGYSLFHTAGSLIAGTAISKNGNALDVNVDDVTVETFADALRVKDAGIDLTKMTNNSVGPDNLVDATTSADTDLGIWVNDNVADISLSGTGATFLTRPHFAASIDLDGVAESAPGGFIHGEPFVATPSTAEGLFMAFDREAGEGTPQKMFYLPTNGIAIAADDTITGTTSTTTIEVHATVENLVLGNSPDDSKTDFPLSFKAQGDASDIILSSLKVWRGGLLQKRVDFDNANAKSSGSYAYDVASGEIRFGVAPARGEELMSMYVVHTPV